MALLLAFLIGFLAGLRSLTAPAATGWAVHLGCMKLRGQLALIGSIPAVAIFTLLAVVEMVADKLPNTPSRTAPPGLIARIVMGGLTGACIAVAGGEGALLGALFGIIGGITGCFDGFHAHTSRESSGYPGHLRRPAGGSGGDRGLAVGYFAILSFRDDSALKKLFHAGLKRRRSELADSAPEEWPGLVGHLRDSGIAYIVIVDVSCPHLRVVFK